MGLRDLTSPYLIENSCEEAILLDKLKERGMQKKKGGSQMRRLSLS
jgi:hypothetical protein